METWKYRQYDEKNPQDGYNLSCNQAAVDSIRRVAVEELALSQEDKPKRHRSAREISHETAIIRSSVHRISHRDLQLKCFKRRRVQLLSEANRKSHSLINNIPTINLVIVLLYYS